MKALVIFLSVIILAYTYRGAEKITAGSPVSADSQFVQEASSINLGEIHISNIAVMKGSGVIKHLAEQIRQDRTAAQQHLVGLAQNLRYPVEPGIDSGYQAKATQLNTPGNNDFDSAYLSQVTEGHDKAIAIFETQAGTGTNLQLVEYANTQLSVLRQHRMMADSITRLLLIQCIVRN